jgi:hypothetical protein
MHSGGDTFEKINPKFFLRAARALVGMMVQIAHD